MTTTSTGASPDRTVPLDEVRDRVLQRFTALSDEGHRVLGLAVRTMPDAVVASTADEREMTLVGLLAFHDPPRSDAAATIRRRRIRRSPLLKHGPAGAFLAHGTGSAEAAQVFV
ncbi:hypothetical protein [Micromonospora sp. NBC_01412]|uniref:hypothetical protein n=1 Tax=Micromonospora sp. NBC_01412 TaxID=2903590 RepID=UPI003250E4E8